MAVHTEIMKMLIVSNKDILAMFISLPRANCSYYCMADWVSYSTKLVFNHLQNSEIDIFCLKITRITGMLLFFSVFLVKALTLHVGPWWRHSREQSECELGLSSVNGLIPLNCGQIISGFAFTTAPFCWMVTMRPGTSFVGHCSLSHTFFLMYLVFVFFAGVAWKIQWSSKWELLEEDEKFGWLSITPSLSLLKPYYKTDHVWSWYEKESLSKSCRVWRMK